MYRQQQILKILKYYLELVLKYHRLSHLVTANVYSLNSVGRYLRRHQKHPASTTTHTAERVQLHKKQYTAGQKQLFCLFNVVFGIILCV